MNYGKTLAFSGLGRWVRQDPFGERLSVSTFGAGNLSDWNFELGYPCVPYPVHFLSFEWPLGLQTSLCLISDNPTAHSTRSFICLSEEAARAWWRTCNGRPRTVSMGTCTIIDDVTMIQSRNELGSVSLG